jgi:hypothetical protein
MEHYMLESSMYDVEKSLFWLDKVLILTAAVVVTDTDCAHMHINGRAVVLLTAH